MKKIGELSERELWVKRMREEEKRTFVGIGRELGIGAARVSQIYRRAVRGVKAERENPYCGLSNHAAEILNYNEIGSRAEVRAKWVEEKLCVRFGRGLGRGTLAEILRWAGIEPPAAKEVRRCRLCGQVVRARRDG